MEKFIQDREQEGLLRFWDFSKPEFDTSIRFRVWQTVQHLSLNDLMLSPDTEDNRRRCQAC